MLPVFGYLACLAAVLPAVGFALFFRAVDKVASAPGLPGLGRMALKLLELMGMPWKFFPIIVFGLGIVAAGCLRSSRGWACLVVGLVGVISLAQVVISSRPAAAGEFVFFLPSTLGTGAALWWAAVLLKADLLA